ncbi:MAG: tRNA-dihydrouridine synthase, partial [Pseudomonadota bacterium]
MTTFKRLFEPLSFNGLQLKNRIVMPPMATNFAGARGEVTDQMISYYEERAKGGAGLVILEVTGVDFPRGNTVLHQVAIHDDSCMEGLSRLVNAVKKWGARIATQLHHAGRRASSKSTGMIPVAPSPIACYGGDMPEVLDKKGILSIIKAFAEGARRAKAVGFDAVELHCAHGYLMGQFLSPLTNTRTDEYGGPLANRVRFVTEIIEAVRGEVGEDYPILARISGDEFIPGGLRISDSVEIARILERTGIDCIHVSGGSTPSNLEQYRAQEISTIPSMYFKGPSFAHLAQEIRRSVGVPVIAVGRINDPLMAEQVLEQDKADLVTMGRALIADPELPNKAYEGRTDEIRKCIACLHCINVVLNQKGSLRCAINPVVGREAQAIPKPEKSKKVLVIGGGPAGMEAARWASSRGHHVSLWEKDRRLGGQLNLAHIPPHKDELKGLTDYLSKQLELHKVPIELGKEATVELIRQYNPDVLILAAGPVAH